MSGTIESFKKGDQVKVLELAVKVLVDKETIICQDSTDIIVMKVESEDHYGRITRYQGQNQGVKIIKPKLTSNKGKSLSNLENKQTGLASDLH